MTAPTERAAAPRCSIIIPVFNRASLTKQCLDVLLRVPPAVAHEIIVVDNGSRDATCDLLAGYGSALVVIRHAANQGFAIACNAGARQARGDLLVFLNNDTVPLVGWLDALVAYADEHPTVAMIGAKLIFPNDTVQHCGVTIAQDRLPRHLYAGFPADHPAVNRSRQVQVVTAACALVRREALAELNGFDTAYFNGYEDVDFCLRLGERGHTVHYCHTSTVLHYESVSAGRFDQVAHNTRLYAERWQSRVRPDDLEFYLADGLLSLAYADAYPMSLRVAPDLATIDRPCLDPLDAEALLEQRARQAQALLRDNIALHVRSLEAEGTVGRPPVVQSPTSEIDRTPVPARPTVVAWGRERQLKGMGGPLLSVLIPTKNGLAGLRQLVPAILEQQCDIRIEIVAIDSGSTDRTVEYLADQGATVVAIAPLSFNHGLTRGLAAEFARGRLLIYVNQTTLPADDCWLANLIAPLADDDLLAGVCSRVLPRPDADPLTRRDGLSALSASATARTVSVRNAQALTAMDAAALRRTINFHTVSAAIRPQALLRVPFRQVPMGEDILWAKEVLATGYRIRHEASSVVYHSHNYCYLDLLRRNVDDGIANQAIVGSALDEASAVGAAKRQIRDDWRYLERDLGLTGETLIEAQVEAALRRAAQMAGQWLGINRTHLPANLDDLLSLAASVRRGDTAARDGL